ncbi:MAG: RluA family pseudouridine synthase [bacterium]|nr:RluA family pseudouridine synthase [bacterium]
MEPKLIFENDSFLALNKPAGMLVHSVKITKNKLLCDKNENTLVDWLLERYPKIKNVGDDPINRPGIVHRLDKDTSGVILVPKTQEYYLYLKSLFQNHKIKKTYLALVIGELKEKEGIISKPIGIKEGTIKRSVFSKKLAKEAITEYKVLKTISPSQVLASQNFDIALLNFLKVLEGKQNLGGQVKIWEGKSARDSLSQLESATVSLLEVTPKTGRTHQIRVHLSSIGHPILGDELYGNKLSKALSQKLNIKRQLLHALSIELEIAPGKNIKIESELPLEFKKFSD